MLEKTSFINGLKVLIEKYSHGNVARFADLIDIPRTTVASWLSGRSIPDGNSLVRIARKCRISIDSLLVGKLDQTGLGPLRHKDFEFAIKVLMRLQQMTPAERDIEIDLMGENNEADRQIEAGILGDIDRKKTKSRRTVGSKGV